MDVLITCDVTKENNEIQTITSIKNMYSSSLNTVIELWLNNLNESTKKVYAYYIYTLIKKNFIPNYITVEQFNNQPHEAIIDIIKKNSEWKEMTRQTYAACYISFTNYLHRISQGRLRKAIPSTLGSSKTFYQVHDKCVTKALTLREWHKFIDVLDTINKRDSLIARCLFQGAKRISECIELTLDRIDREKNMITFIQKKTGGLIKEIPITYPEYFMNELFEYIESTETRRRNNVDGPVFITRTGKKITRSRLSYSFKEASQRANIVHVTPHMLRVTWVTLVKQQGVQDTEIMKVTGHTTSKMIYAYDKTSAQENITKKFTVI